MEAMALIEIDGWPINSMVIFHGYVKKPEGNTINTYYIYIPSEAPSNDS